MFCLALVFVSSLFRSSFLYVFFSYVCSIVIYACRSFFLYLVSLLFFLYIVIVVCFGVFVCFVVSSFVRYAFIWFCWCIYSLRPFGRYPVISFYVSFFICLLCLYVVMSLFRYAVRSFFVISFSLYVFRSLGIMCSSLYLFMCLYVLVRSYIRSFFMDRSFLSIYIYIYIYVCCYVVVPSSLSSRS